MPWIHKSPFASHEDPVEHMVVLLSREAENAGTPFSAEEKKSLRSERASGESVPEELRQKSRKLIEQLLKKEQTRAANKDPKSFDSCLQWAGDREYPNIVALTEEVMMSGGFGVLPLHGRRLAKDRMQLVGCALSVVLFMFLIVVAFSMFFHGK
jgi:hypothetical protein